MRASVAFTALVALVAAPAAGAHLGSGKPGYKSTVKRIEPALAGIRVTVLGGEDRILLNNVTGRTVTVLGYSREPYLRFGPDGVYENVRSPAMYLNSDRYARVRLPKEANSKASPRWKKVVLSEVWSWHDHRIHWMSTIAPPKVRAAPSSAHHLFNWDVPLRVGGRRYEIAGSLDYHPPKQSGGILLSVIGAVALAGAIILTVVAVPLVRFRRQTTS